MPLNVSQSSSSPPRLPSFPLVFLPVWWPVRRRHWKGRELTKSSRMRSDPPMRTLGQALRCADRWAWRGPASVSHLIFIRPPRPEPDSSRPASQHFLWPHQALLRPGRSGGHRLCDMMALALCALLPSSLTVRPNHRGEQKTRMKGGMGRRQLETEMDLSLGKYQ